MWADVPSPPNQLPDNNAILLSISSNSKKTIFGVISPNFWLVMLQPGGHAAAAYQNSSNPAAAGHMHMASSQAAGYMSANGAPPSVTAGVKHERLAPTSQYNRSNSESAALALQQHIHQRQQHSAAAAAAAAQQAGMVSRENIF